MEITASSPGVEDKVEDKLDKLEEKITWDEDGLHSVNGQPPLTSLLISEPIVPWEHNWSTSRQLYENISKIFGTFKCIPMTKPTWLVEDGDADLSFLVNVGVPHLSQDPAIWDQIQQEPSRFRSWKVQRQRYQIQENLCKHRNPNTQTFNLWQWPCWPNYHPHKLEVTLSGYRVILSMVGLLIYFFSVLTWALEVWGGTPEGREGGT